MRKAFVFDFDDTLATTDAVTLVRENFNHHVVARLTPRQMNAHNLHKSCYYDYCEFKDDTFIQKANPTWLMALAKEVAAERHNVFILTARNQIVADSIYQWLKTHDIDAATVVCVGDQAGGVAINKKRVLLDLVEKFDKTYFYDDSEENVNIFSHEKLRSYQV